MIFKNQRINIAGATKFKNTEENSEAMWSPTWVGRDETVTVGIIFLQIKMLLHNMGVQDKGQQSQNRDFAK